jgi:D-glycero-alpha-D-manno-heptose-7-phosphate kinase
MVISRTPFRISFFGGGTDYPTWYREHGGSVLAATINKYCYLTCRYLPPFFEHRTKVVYSKIETVQTVDEIQHPSARELLRYLAIERGVEIHHDGDLPRRSGMGSSSSFTVGLLHALYALKGQIVGKRRLALESIHIEQDVLKENVGSQDQVCAAYGGVNLITFCPSGDISVRPVTLAPQRQRELKSHLMLFYTGIMRTASDIAASFITHLAHKRETLMRMRELVDTSSELLSGTSDIVRFGRLLHEAWLAKRSLSEKVSNSQVDALYQEALDAGAVGGKLLGAGGGGFMLFFVPPEKQALLRSRLNKLIHVPFEFEFAGSQIVFFEPEEDFTEHYRAREQQQIAAFQELGGGPL